MSTDDYNTLAEQLAYVQGGKEVCEAMLLRLMHIENNLSTEHLISDLRNMVNKCNSFFSENGL